jgi:hypothetical protein
MHGFVLQDWTTIRGGSGISTVTQSEHQWLSLDGYQDLIAWIDIRELTLGTLTNIAFNLQTAPIKDEILFTTMESSPLLATQALTTPSVRTVVLSVSSAWKVPLGTFVRWQLVTNANPIATWDASFRILLCANPLSGGGGMMGGGRLFPRG